MWWLMLAEKLGMSLAECQLKVSSKEFVLWKVYMQREPSRFHREDYLFAMVAAEVRRTISRNPNKVKTEDFLLKFKDPKKKKPQMSLEAEKSIWLSAVGLDPDIANKNREEEDV